MGILLTLGAGLVRVSGIASQGFEKQAQYSDRTQSFDILLFIVSYESGMSMEQTG